MIRFDIDTGFQNDLRKFSRNVSKMVDKLDNRDEPMQKIKKRQIKQWQTNFDRDGAIYGAWKDLAPSTRANRGSGKILLETGGLLAHFTTLNNAGEVTNDSITWNIWNKAHGQGGSRGILAQHMGFGPRGGFHSIVPARTLWAFNQQDEDEAEDIMEQWVSRIINTYYGV